MKTHFSQTLFIYCVIAWILQMERQDEVTYFYIQGKQIYSSFPISDCEIVIFYRSQGNSVLCNNETHNLWYWNKIRNFSSVIRVCCCSFFFFLSASCWAINGQIWLERNIRNPKLITFRLKSCSCLLPNSLFKSILIQNFIYSEKICDYPIIHGCSIVQIHCFVTVVKKNHFFRSTFPMPPKCASFSTAYKISPWRSSLSALWMFSFACSVEVEVVSSRYYF